MSLKITKKEIQEAIKVIEWGSKDYEEFQKSIQLLKKVAEDLPESFYLKQEQVGITLIKTFMEDLFQKVYIYYGNNGYLIIEDNLKMCQIFILNNQIVAIKSNIIPCYNELDFLYKLKLDKTKIKIDVYIDYKFKR